MVRVHTIREHQTLIPGPTLSREEIADLDEFARTVLKRSDGNLAASNHVGVVTTRRGTVVEVLPKIDLDNGPDASHEQTRRLFLQMLRCWRRLATQLPQSDIRAMSRFPMLEFFVRQFLNHLTVLMRSGLARRYVTIEENLPYLRGRLLFREHIRENLCNRARFYASHDEFSVNRPANRPDPPGSCRSPAPRSRRRQPPVAPPGHCRHGECPTVTKHPGGLACSSCRSVNAPLSLGHAVA